ncbi:MAG: hypothetical protein ACK2UB_00125 [Anaerolineales bacterium]|jgi:hypothetical protein
MPSDDTQPTRPISSGRSAPKTGLLARLGGLRAVLPWPVWAAGALAGLAVAVIAWIVLAVFPIPTLPAESLPPDFTVFPPPTFTPIPPTPEPTPIFSPTAALPTVMPGTIGVGGMVEVTEDGLRLRDAPSLSGLILNQASAHELFTVVDGPRTADGYTWWLLQGVYDTSRQGWAVENYLKAA